LSLIGCEVVDPLVGPLINIRSPVAAPVAWTDEKRLGAAGALLVNVETFLPRSERENGLAVFVAFLRVSAA
jgi:hypothetical protein